MGDINADVLKERYKGLLEESLIEVIWGDYNDHPEKADQVLQNLAHNSIIDRCESQDRGIRPEAILNGGFGDDTESLMSDQDAMIDLKDTVSRRDLVNLLCQCLPECPPSFVEQRLEQQVQGQKKIDANIIPALIETVLDDFYSDFGTSENAIYTARRWINTDPSMEAVSAKYGMNNAHARAKPKNSKKLGRSRDRDFMSKRHDQAQKRAHKNQWEYEDNGIKEIMEMFPDTSIDRLVSLYHTKSGVLEEVVDVLSGEQAFRQGDKPFLSHSPKGKAKTTALEREVWKSTTIGFKDPNRYARSINTKETGAESAYSPEHCRQVAEELNKRRNEMYKKAATSFQKRHNKGGSSGIASYYALEVGNQPVCINGLAMYDIWGHKINDEAKLWNMRAARAYIDKARRQSQDPNLLDLHYLTRAEAIAIASEELSTWYAREVINKDNASISPLKIITGYGNHSGPRAPTLYPSINKLLKEQSWKYRFINGGFLVLGAE
ncbi:hypothetical protein H4219_001835 [Mycoemilia scoparia]|uniref:Smr domain-containing protein n=1 Tax=Mycoemilia scoparia TaxID=417184 RepID=A0A9W8DVK9_9FUNG|nr:hypothetical protein H4219_001835 [Mycoemilia scoparia]